MKKYFLSLVIGIIATFGVGAGASPAFANSCSVTPNQPGIAPVPQRNIQMSTTFNCDVVPRAIAWYDQLNWAGAQNGAVRNDWAVNYPSGTSFLPYTSFACQWGYTATWSHYTFYKFMWPGTNVWGPDHVTPRSPTVFGNC